MTNPNGNGISTHLPISKILQSRRHRLHIQPPPIRPHRRTQNLPELLVSILKNLPHLHNLRQPSPLQTNRDPRPAPLRPLLHQINMRHILRNRPLDIYILARKNARIHRLEVLIDTRVADDEVDVRVVGELLGVAVGLNLWIKVVVFDCFFS